MANQLENIAGLQSILETVNSLPDAGSGGGGTPETCTVTIELASYTDVQAPVDLKTYQYQTSDGSWTFGDPMSNMQASATSEVSTVTGSAIHFYAECNMYNLVYQVAGGLSVIAQNGFDAVIAVDGNGSIRITPNLEN